MTTFTGGIMPEGERRRAAATGREEVPLTAGKLVGIGLPSHNGEAYVGQALESLLAQDHEAIEIVVSDNASTDATPDIVREIAARDPRVRVHRTDDLLTAPQNFNRAFDLSRGDYFMWAADDDLWDPSYVRRCLAALEAEPSAVMASAGLRFIDPAGAILDAVYRSYDNPDLSSPSVVERVRGLLGRAGWYQVYGLARREALLRTNRFQDVYGPDVVLSLELAMLGPILLVPETLFYYRRYPDRTAARRLERQGGIADAGVVASTPTTHLQEALADAVRSADLPRAVKLRLVVEILRATYVDDTPMHARARRELPIRAVAAARGRDVRGVARFTLLRIPSAISGLGRSRRRARAGRSRESR
jgi:GT2 family glycosyltransferase